MKKLIGLLVALLLFIWWLPSSREEVCFPPILNSKSKIPTIEWIGTGKKSQQEVYESCRSKYLSLYSKLNDIYGKLLPNACAIDPLFSEFDKLPTSYLSSKYRFSDDDPNRERYLYDAKQSAKIDCKWLKEARTDKVNRSINESNTTFSPRDYPDNLKLSRREEIYSDSVDLLCYLNADCRNLLEEYWKSMRTCVFVDNKLGEYIVKETYVCSSMPLGGSGSTRVLKVEDYSKSPKPIKGAPKL